MKSLALVFAFGVSVTAMAHAQVPTSDAPQKAITDDPYLWLEAHRSPRAMEWVHAQNAITTHAFMQSSEFATTRGRILQVLDADTRIPGVRRMGDYLYNFWQDKAHPRGIWRRTTLAEYRKSDPAWETVLDTDALNEAEGKKWVFKGAECMKPEYTHCLVSLSPGGGDAVEVREFDIPSKSFVKDGFFLPVAKSDVGWIDANHIYVGTDFGPGSMTPSSYPRIVKEWTRGTPLSSATQVYAGETTDMSVSASHDRTPGFERDLVTRSLAFFSSETYLRGKDGKLTKIDVPDDAIIDAQREWLLIQTRSAWKVGDKTYPSGALLAAHFDDFMAGKRELTVLFAPTETTSLDAYS